MFHCFAQKCWLKALLWICSLKVRASFLFICLFSQVEVLLVLLYSNFPLIELQNRLTASDCSSGWPLLSAYLHALFSVRGSPYRRLQAAWANARNPPPQNLICCWALHQVTGITIVSLPKWGLYRYWVLPETFILKIHLTCLTLYFLLSENNNVFSRDYPGLRRVNQS